MKQFKDYLTESTKTYPFRVKIAGEVPENFEKRMKSILSKFSVESVGKGKRTPIQSTPLDFPNLKDIEVTAYEVNLKYPVTSHNLSEYISHNLGINPEKLRVRNPAEQAEIDQQQEHLLDSFKTNPKGSLLTQDYDAENHQDKVGEKRISEFMKELAAIKGQHSGINYTGVNDQILADSVPKEKEPPTVEDSGKTSPLGSRQNKLHNSTKGK
jgi:hypothetical protein